MNGITYYQTRSPYRGDFTKNCSLNGFEIDSNFLNLEGRDIRRMYTRGCTLYAELYNGETISTTIDSCGGGSGSGSCDCEREINYLEGQRDVEVTYNYSIDGIGNFNISVPCRLTPRGITNIGQARSTQIENLVFTPLEQSEPYNSFEISGTYSSGGQTISIHIYTTGALFKQGVYSDSQFQINVGTCTVYTIEGSYTGNLEVEKENIFRFPIATEIHDNGISLVFNEGARITYEHNHQRIFDLYSSTSNYGIIALSDDSIGNILNMCQINENHHFLIGILWLDSAIPQPQEVDLMTSITWSELKSLRDNSQLIPGMQYRIIDYDCTTVQEDTDSAHHPFDIIVFADDEHTLNENARAAEREFIPKTLKLDYNVTVNLATGNSNYYPGRYEGENESLFITQHNDTNYIKLLDENNIIYYVDSNNLLYDSNFTSTGEDVNFTGEYVSKWCGYLNAIQDGIETINGTVYVRWQITSYNTNNGGINSDDIFGFQNINYVYSLSDNPTGFDEVLCNDNGNVSSVFVELASRYNLLDIPITLDKYRLFSPTLSITDESVYFANCNLEAWELKYCLDNDSNRFAWADDRTMSIELYNCLYNEIGSFQMGSDELINYAITCTYNPFNLYCYNNEVYFKLSVFHGAVTLIPEFEAIDTIYIKTTTSPDFSAGLYSKGNDVWVCINNEMKPFHSYTSSIGITAFTKLEVSLLQDKTLYNFTYDSSEENAYVCSDFPGSVIYSQPGSNEISARLPLIEDNTQTTLVSIPSGTSGVTLLTYANLQYLGLGRGVIYYMKDDRNNELPYDFKNIMFKRTIDGSDVKLYTFTQTVGGTVSDASVYKNSTLKDGVFENIIKPYYTGYNNSVRRSLNQNVFYSSGILLARTNTFGVDSHSNTFGDGCYSNTFGGYCYSNTFGDGCYSNTFGGYCSSNTFGGYCSANTFGGHCYSNTFGDNCSSNTFGDNCSSNTFGGYCSSNTFGDNCSSNTFGGYCSANTFGGHCYSNTFGDNCSSNTFGYGCSGIFIKDSNQNTIDNIRFIHVFNNVANRNIYTDFQGNYLAQDATYTQYVAKNRDGNLVIWNPADLALPPQQP